MIVLKFAGSLVAAVGIHALGVRTIPEFAAYVDLFLLLTVAWAFETTTLAGLAVGLAAGLTADAYAGGLYGLNGFADTLVGYLTALAVTNLAKMSTAGAGLLYALAGVVQQILLTTLVVLLIPAGAPPAIPEVIGKTVLTGVAGVVVFRGRRRFVRAVGQWRQARESKLRF
mgnify:CR=1 FL=1